MDEIANCHPKPNGPFPPPEPYDTAKCGPNPERPLLVGMGMDADAVPVVAFTLNFSPMPLIAPPPLGSLMAGRFPGREWELSEVFVELVDVDLVELDGVFGIQSAMMTDRLDRSFVQ
jgi:hypothetical protein